MDRRALLKTVATISAAALLPDVPAIAETAPAVTPVAPLSVKPYADYVWQWFVSHDGETYYESFPTKEEAIQYAQQCDYSLVAECMQQDFRLEVDGHRLIEELNESNYDLIGEGEGIECSNAQRIDLENMVQKAIEAWVVKHNINITAWSFDGTRNETDVPLPETTLALSSKEAK